LDTLRFEPLYIGGLGFILGSLKSS